MRRILQAVALMGVCATPALASGEPAIIPTQRVLGNLMITSGYDLGPAFRGTRTTRAQYSFFLDLEYSWFGWSAGVLETFASDGRSHQTELFASYSYPFGYVDVTTGMQGFINQDTGHRDSFELFVECRTEPIQGLNIYAGQFLEVTHQVHSYTELKVSHRFRPIRERLSIEPNAIFAFGNYHSHNFAADHVQIGFDSELRVTTRMSVGINAGIVIPLDGSKAVVGSSPAALFGCRISWHF